MHLFIGFLELLWDVGHDVTEQTDAFSEGPGVEANPCWGFAGRTLGLYQNFSLFFLLGGGEEVIIFCSDPFVVGFDQRHNVEFGRLVIIIQLIETTTSLYQIQIQFRLPPFLCLVLHVGLKVRHIFMKSLCFLLGPGRSSRRRVLILLIRGGQGQGFDLCLLGLRKLLSEGELTIHGLMCIF